MSARGFFLGWLCIRIGVCTRHVLAARSAGSTFPIRFPGHSEDNDDRTGSLHVPHVPPDGFTDICGQIHLVYLSPRTEYPNRFSQLLHQAQHRRVRQKAGGRGLVSLVNHEKDASLFDQISQDGRVEQRVAQGVEDDNPRRTLVFGQLREQGERNGVTRVS